MLPKPLRLRRRSDFRKVYSRGRSFVHPLMVLYVRPAEHGGTRFGYSLSKKLGGAVQRNRMKRRLREICRSRVGELTPGFDLVVVGRSRLRAASYTEIEGVLADLCRKARVMPAKPARSTDTAE